MEDIKVTEYHLKSETSGLFGIMQNEALSAIALHSFTLGYYNIASSRKDNSLYPRLEHMFYILPIVYNYSSMLSFLNSQEIYTALAKEHSITLGLQDRANKMASQTFNALNLAFSKKILSFDKSNNTVLLIKPFTSKKLPISSSSYNTFDNVKRIQDCAYRLGSVFAKRHDKNIQLDLNIRF